MKNTSRGNRLHIGFYGKTNVGKSTLLNKITKQDVSIVSEQKGTTTDVVYKPMELLPIGPVVFMDTAGLDDNTKLSKERTKKTINTVDKADIAVIICDFDGWDNTVINFAKELNKMKTPILAVVTKNDIQKISNEKLLQIKEFTKNVLFSKPDDTDFTTRFKTTLTNILPPEFIDNKTITGNLVKEKDTVIMVIPIDKEAPKGRLILPQVQVLRELLDKNIHAIAVKETELETALSMLKIPPKLVITDSQAFKEVAKIVPDSIPLTSFSILFANYKGDIKTFVEGAKALDNLKDGAKILFLESCTHHPIEDDIARVKIPKLIEKKTGKSFKYTYHSGCALPENITKYDFVIHCGACMTNGKEVLSRIYKFKEENIPITNYGVIIAYCLGILDRATRPIIKK